MPAGCSDFGAPRGNNTPRFYSQRASKRKEPRTKLPEALIEIDSSYVCLLRQTTPIEAAFFSFLGPGFFPAPFFFRLFFASSESSALGPVAAAIGFAESMLYRTLNNKRYVAGPYNLSSATLKRLARQRSESMRTHGGLYVISKSYRWHLAPCFSILLTQGTRYLGAG